MTSAWNVQDCSRELTLAAIKAGGLSDGRGARAVTEFYGEATTMLAGVDRELGTEAMNTATHLTIASMTAGLIYPSESITHLHELATGIRESDRAVAKKADRPTQLT
jgi:hypothetical protein